MFTYTARNQLETYILPDTGSGPAVESRVYDESKRLKEVHRPDGRVISFDYQLAKDRLEKITSPRGETKFLYNPTNGLVAEIEEPDGQKVAFEYEGTLLKRTSWTGEVNGSVGRTYDNNFRVKTIDVNGEDPIEYVYDDDNLLIQVGEMTITRDPVTGREVSTQLGNVTTLRTYTAFGEPESYTAKFGETEEAGELLAKTEGGETTTYDYDVFGNLRKVELPNGINVEYVTDGTHRRIGKKVNGVLVKQWLYQGQLEPVAELDLTAAYKIQFVYGTRKNSPDYLNKAGDLCRILVDQVGSTRLFVHAVTGAILAEFRYDEFGRKTLGATPSLLDIGFAGGLDEVNTGFVKLGARDYDTSLGRWTVVDPIDFNSGQLNLYSYVAASPLTFNDNNGLAVVNNLTGVPIVVSGNAGEGHGTGGQVWGVLQPGQTGGGSNPVPGYATRADALDAANGTGSPVAVGDIHDIDFCDDPGSPTRRSESEADRKLWGDEGGPLVDLELDDNGNLDPDYDEISKVYPIGRRIAEAFANFWPF